MDQSVQGGFSHTLILKTTNAGGTEYLSDAFTVTLIGCSQSFPNLDNKQIDSEVVLDFDASISSFGITPVAGFTSWDDLFDN